MIELQEDAMLPVKGNTYPVKDQIRALGGRWDGRRKVWMVPDDVFIQAQELVSNAPASQPRRSYGNRNYGSRYTRFSSGAEIYTNRNGRCEDAPCCGCCS